MNAAEEAAGWLAEAWETGNPIAAPLPEDLAPTDAEAGERIAAALVARLGLTPIGLRLAPGPRGEWLAGPVLEPRMLRAGTPLSVAAYPGARLSAGILGVLGEALGEGEPVFSALHPVLDLAAERWTTGAPDAAHRLADLNGLGLLLVGKRSAAPGLPQMSDARLGRTGERPRPERTPVAALVAEAAAAARRWGGLPAGAVIAVVGLGGSETPRAGERWSAGVPPVGRINAEFV